MESVNYEANGGRRRNDLLPAFPFAAGQTWLCDSQNNSACWSGACNHDKLGASQCCLALVNSNEASQGQINRTPRHLCIPMDATYAYSSYTSTAQQSNASTSIDYAAWLPDVIAAKAEPVEKSGPTSDLNSPSRTAKPTAEGEITRPKGYRLPHHLVERRYRDKLNHQIEVLRDRLPAFKSIVACTVHDGDATSLGGKWPSKPVVIAAAVQYITLLEQERGQANVQNTLLREQVKVLQKLVSCDDCSIVQHLNGMQPCAVFDQ